MLPFYDRRTFNNTETKIALDKQPTKKITSNNIVEQTENKSGDEIEEENKDNGDQLDVSTTFINKAHAIPGSL